MSAHSFLQRLRALILRRRLERDLDAELAFHHAMASARGSGHRFGNDVRLREAARDAWLFAWLEVLGQDLRFALRGLRRTPGFAAIVILTLALGIGANAAIFTLLNSLLLRPPPVREPSTLVLVNWRARQFPRFSVGFSFAGSCDMKTQAGLFQGCIFSQPMYAALRDAPQLFASLAAAAPPQQFDLSRQGQASMATGQFVSGNYFHTLGVPAARGRLLQPADDSAEAPPTAVVSAAYWRHALGASPDVVGQSVYLNGVAATIVGVVASGFPGLVPGANDDIWLPLAQRMRFVPQYKPEDSSAGLAFLTLSGRLRQGITRARAEAAATMIWARAAEGGPKPLLTVKAAPRITLPPAQQALLGSRFQYTHPLRLLMLAVGVLLAIACANIAGLLIVRSDGRRRELAVRRALGASNARILRQLLVESCLLAAAGGLAGLALGYWGARGLTGLVNVQAADPMMQGVSLDWRVLGFTAAVTLVVGLLSGLAPAWSRTRTPLASVMQSAAGGRRRRSRLGASLVVAQVALSLVLLAGAGLLLRTLNNLRQTPRGFDVHNLLTFAVHPSLLGYKGPALAQLYEHVQTRLAAVPGVSSVAYSSAPLLSPALAEGYTILMLSSGQHRLAAKVLGIGPNYLPTLRVPLLAGRYFLPADLQTPAGEPRPVVVDAPFVRAYFKDRTAPAALVNAQPTGRIVMLGGGAAAAPEKQILGLAKGVGAVFATGKRSAGYRIIGVVGATQFADPREAAKPTIFMAGYGNTGFLTVRSAASPAVLLPAIHKAVAAADPRLPISNLQTQQQNLDQLLFQDRMLAHLAAGFGGLALLLAALGLYGLLAHEVARQRQEIGIRLALGASPTRIINRVATRGLVLTFFGLALGTLGAWVALRVLQQQLYGVVLLDPLTFLGAALALATAAVLAATLPARRAVRCDPASVLRAE